MVSVCFYFQVHQPFRLAKYHVFDIDKIKNILMKLKIKEFWKKLAENVTFQRINFF